MKVVVLGGSGRAGSEIVNELARRGHDVVAVARKPEAIAAQRGVEIRAADAQDSSAVAAIIRGADAVISAMHFDVTAATLLSALRQAAVSRLLVTGGAASLETMPGKRVIDMPDFPEEWKVFALGGIRFLEDLCSEREIVWTFLSPPLIIFEGPRLGHYRTGGDQLLIDDLGESKISFADYAIAMVDELEHDRHLKSRFTVAY